jgi:hypothetical protein
LLRRMTKRQAEGVAQNHKSGSRPQKRPAVAGLEIKSLRKRLTSLSLEA